MGPGGLHRANLFVLQIAQAQSSGAARNRSSTAQHMLRQLVSPGKRPITFVRFTSSNERSNRFEDRNRLRSRRKWDTPPVRDGDRAHHGGDLAAA
jgi:hypothetical protein